MVRSAGLSLAALTLALLAPFSAGWAQSESDTCTWENAEPISVYALERSGTSLHGRCVRVIGQTEGWALRSQRRSGSVQQTTFIGAYIDNEELAASLAEHLRRVEALGVVGHCSDVCAEEWDAVEAARAEGRSIDNMPICMPIGFCHYYSDPYVRIRDVR